MGFTGTAAKQLAGEGDCSGASGQGARLHLAETPEGGLAGRSCSPMPLFGLFIGHARRRVPQMDPPTLVSVAGFSNRSCTVAFRSLIGRSA